MPEYVEVLASCILLWIWQASIKDEPPLLVRDFFVDATVAEAGIAKKELNRVCNAERRLEELNKTLDALAESSLASYNEPELQTLRDRLNSQKILLQTLPAHTNSVHRRNLELMVAGLPYPIQFGSKIKRGSSGGQKMVFPPLQSKLFYILFEFLTQLLSLQLLSRQRL